MSSQASSPAVRRQVAVLPVRTAAGVTEVLLITSRETKRWIVPKGWLPKHVAPRHMAAREAFEEAGVVGHVTKKPIGRYRYAKRLSPTDTVPCDVDVYVMFVERQTREWPEKGERQQCWVRPDVAASMVEPSLAVLLRRLSLRRSRRKGPIVTLTGSVTGTGRPAGG